MIRTHLFNGSQVKDDVPLDDWRSLVESEGALLWVDARSLTADDMSLLASKFGLHAMAVESCLGGYRRPHLYEFEDHLYVNMTVVGARGSDHPLKASELHVFLGHSFVITATREAASEAVDKALKVFVDTPGLCKRGSIYAIYLLAGDLVDTYYPAIEKLDDEADKIETLMLEKADKHSLRRLFALKRRCFDLRKLLGPQRDLFNELARRDFPFVEGESQVYFQDTYNRMVRIFDMLDTIREILSGSLDIYLSTVSNRLNEIMKVLTVGAIILMVLSFITGFYGMNLENLPLQHGANAVRDVTILMVVLCVAMLLWFRHRGWM